MPDARVALILCQSPGAVAAAFEGDEPPHAVLVDESRDVARAYGVYVALAFDSLNIARPATFVIDRDRVVRLVFVASNQFEHPKGESVRAAVEAARS